MLADAVSGEPGDDGHRGLAADVDDPAEPPGLHSGQHAGAEAGGGPDIDGEDTVPFARRGVLQRLPHGAAGVVDQHINRSGLGLGRCRSRAIDSSLVRSVTTGMATPPAGGYRPLLLQFPFPPGRQHHRRALGRQHRRQPRADPGRAPVTTATRPASTAIATPLLRSWTAIMPAGTSCRQGCGTQQVTIRARSRCYGASVSARRADIGAAPEGCFRRAEGRAGRSPVPSLRLGREAQAAPAARSGLLWCCTSP